MKPSWPLWPQNTAFATADRSKEEIALDLARAVYAEFGKQEGPLQFTRRAPQKRGGPVAENGH